MDVDLLVPLATTAEGECQAQGAAPLAMLAAPVSVLVKAGPLVVPILSSAQVAKNPTGPGGTPVLVPVEARSPQNLGAAS